MPYPEINNRSGFQFQHLFFMDEAGRPLLTTIVKATFTIQKNGKLLLAEEQTQVNLAGEYWGAPDASSYKYEPETAFFKPATDVILIGHAWAPHTHVAELAVTLRIGSIQKMMMVFGHRYWIKSLGTIAATQPLPFEKIPLIAEHAFGGWDRSHADIAKHTFEPRNPVGVGFHAKHGSFQEGMPLPNLEYFSERIRHFHDAPAPALFGYVSPHWQPRAGLGGTYDSAWQEERMPLLPTDFDKRYFCGAPQDQIVTGYLKGHEPVMVVNATKNSPLQFDLPGMPAPECVIGVQGLEDQSLRTVLDTVIINCDEMRLNLIWRASMNLPKGFEDVVSIQIHSGSWLNTNL